jgi:hypothetical protein
LLLSGQQVGEGYAQDDFDIHRLTGLIEDIGCVKAGEDLRSL